MNTTEITSKLLARSSTSRYPGAERIVGTLSKLRAAIFPGYYDEALTQEALLTDIHRELSEAIGIVSPREPSETSASLITALPGIQQLLHKDAQAGFDGDPAARSTHEVILSYPGFYAVFVHRIAHYLFLKDIPLIPRIMSEHAHSVTGIDIHPGAQIGEYFFIDHGTGVVIGETAVIGNHVKLYQGVTIGALSVKKDQASKSGKRHPTIRDNVTVYSGASILGGDTVIGEGAVIGGNAFIVKSVPAKTVVKIRSPELQYNDGSGRKSVDFDQPDVWFYQI